MPKMKAITVLSSAYYTLIRKYVRMYAVGDISIVQYVEGPNNMNGQRAARDVSQVAIKTCFRQYTLEVYHYLA